MDWKNKVPILLSILLIFLFINSSIHAQTVEIVNNNDGSKILVDGKPFMIKGMNWGYMPIGQNYTYDFWGKSDEFIKAALEPEMLLLKNMGVNTIRHYVGIPPRWVQYIYETYGIYTVVNHTLGRYGVTVDGAYVSSTDYSDPKTRSILLAEVEALVDEFQGTPGMLFWMLGNENNYGLTWTSAETEALPEGERHKAKARYMYSLFSEATDLIKSKDSRPVSMANGDLQYIDIISEELTNLDIFGTNVYRGISARDAFEVIKEKLGIPFMFTEFGSDAFNMRTMSEDQYMQARYLKGQWQEIYEQAYGMGRVGNSCGGFTFQFSDGWWKFKQVENLDVHDVNASWPNGGYTEDFVEGQNNMNEEWWGICAKGFPDARGFYKLFPRAAYYTLQKVNKINPYDKSYSLEKVRSDFERINLMDAVLKARGDKASLESSIGSKVRLSGLDMRLETISTGGTRVTTPENPLPFLLDTIGYPKYKGYDHFESYYAQFEAKPANNVTGNVTLNILGNIPDIPIDQIYYENRGRVKRRFMIAESDNIDTTSLEDIQRVKVYNASVSWEDKWFNLNAFYRVGHYHWGYEGDFFHLYREANYGPNIDTYGGEAPIGFEIEAKRDLNGLKVAYGPELWWGANPAVIFKYQRQFNDITATGMYQEDVEDQTSVETSGAIPVPATRKATLHLEKQRGNLTIEVGGIWSGDNKKGQEYTYFKDEDPNQYYRSEIKSQDAFGAKLKLSYAKGRYSWYLQAASMGLVADGGSDQIQTYTGWWLKDSGKGNQRNLFTGVSMRFGNFEIAPNFAWQKPLRGPIPDVPRNVRSDPFAVRENREMKAAELVFTYDPTPATWMYHWDSDRQENAKFAFTLGLIYKDFPTTQDVAIAFFEDGVTTFAFPSATPARSIWEAYARIISKQTSTFGLIANLFAGEGEPNGNDTRLIKRYGMDLKVLKESVTLHTVMKFNDWGPYDYHRDFNLTFPVQFEGNLSMTLGNPDWIEVPQTRIGVKGIYRTLNQYSPRYIYFQDEILSDIMDDGVEWEIRTYIHFSLGQLTF